MPDITIEIIFKHRNFAALTAEEVPPQEKLDGAKLWNFPTDCLLKHRFEDYQFPMSNNHYTGEITICPLSFELESFERNLDRELDMQKTPHGFVRLPTIVVKAILTLKDIPSKVCRTLRWYEKITEPIDYQTMAAEDNKKLSDSIEAIMSGGDKLLDFVKKNKRDPNLIHILARPSDEEFVEDFKERITKYEKSLKPQETEFLLRFSSVFESLLSITDKEHVKTGLELVGKKMKSVTESKSKLLEFQDKDGTRLRWRYWSEIWDKLNSVQKGTKRKPASVDPVLTKSFGEDVFRITQYYWNLIIRYLRYEGSQYWLEEMPSYEIGQFFIKNSANILPYAAIQMDLMLISDEVDYVTHEKWNEFLEVTNDITRLKRYSGGFEIGGIFSQAMTSLVNKEFEVSVILALIGLDYAMAEVLQIIRPKFTGSTPGKRIPVVRKEFKVRDKLNLIEKEYHDSWDVIMHERKKTGLLFLRNRVVHEELKLSSSDNVLRSDILEMIKTARLLAYRLTAWKRQQSQNKQYS